MTLVLDSSNVKQLSMGAQLLQHGDVVALPTETVYGLAGLALNPLALAKIFQLKNRPHFDPLIVHVKDSSWVNNLVLSVSPLQEKLMKKFWPGPLSILFQKSNRVPDLCTSSSPMVALRSPKHEVFQKVLEILGEPLAAPSANRFGRISPTCVQDVLEELGPFGLEAVLEGGRCKMGLESTVLNVLNENQIEILRSGSLTLEEIKAELGSGVEISIRKSGHGMTQDAPGMLESHYAPKVSVYTLENLDPKISKEKSCLLLPFPNAIQVESNQWKSVHYLCEREDQDGIAAAKLFSLLRQLDHLNPEAIVVALPTCDHSLWRAIKDRLQRAAFKKQ